MPVARGSCTPSVLLLWSYRDPTHRSGELCIVIRHRDQLAEPAASWVQRMQKAIVIMNLQSSDYVVTVFTEMSNNSDPA